MIEGSVIKSVEDEQLEFELKIFIWGITGTAFFEVSFDFEKEFVIGCQENRLVESWWEFSSGFKHGIVTL